MDYGPQFCCITKSHLFGTGCTDRWQFCVFKSPQQFESFQFSATKKRWIICFEIYWWIDSIIQFTAIVTGNVTKWIWKRIVVMDWIRTVSATVISNDHIETATKTKSISKAPPAMVNKDDHEQSTKSATATCSPFVQQIFNNNNKWADIQWVSKFGSPRIPGLMRNGVGGGLRNIGMGGQHYKSFRINSNRFHLHLIRCVAEGPRQ